MNDRNFYERFWSEHREHLGRQMAIHVESRRPLLNLLEKHLPADSPCRFLEVGCGTALDSCLLLGRRPRAEAIAIDLAHPATIVAGRNAAALRMPLRVSVADLNAMPFPPAIFDLVFSQGVLEHFEQPWTAIAEQVRVLRPGGVLVIDVPQRFNLHTLQKRRAMKENRWPWGWETEYSVNDLRGWASRFGLRVLDAAGHQHGRVLDRLIVHPHRMLRNKLGRGKGTIGHSAAYAPGTLARAWENLWDKIDARLGPYCAINVAVAFRKPEAA